MSELLARFRARENDHRTCIVDVEGAHAYAEVAFGARRVAARLLGERSTLGGRRVALLFPPGAAFVETLFGILFAGGCALVLSPLHPPKETEFFCRDAGVETILVGPELESLVQFLGTSFHVERLERDEARAEATAKRFPDVRADAAALQLYTSGTTGRPKGAVLTHENLAVQQRLVGDAWAFDGADVLLHTLPLHHMHGLAIALLTALGAGATVRTTSFEASAVWDAMAEATVFMGVPAMYHRLFVAYDAADGGTRARWSANAARLRLATSGSAALPVTLAERWRAITGTIPLERFGMTEIGVGLSNSLAGERFPGCVGLPLPTVEARVVGESGDDVALGEAGELLVRGPSVFAGYHERPAETALAFVEPGGWFRTGDTVMRDPSLPGAPFRVLGRTSVDILKSGGYKLSALEIEEVLRQHPLVGEVAVVGVPDEAWGDRVVACIVACEAKADGRTERQEPDSPATALRSFAKEHLAPYKVPKDFIFLPSLPKNALGKVVKPDLVRSLVDPAQRRA
jgi:malonyl-CoA/methylmalonyl-CoA synthetase